MGRSASKKGVHLNKWVKCGIQVDGHATYIFSSILTFEHAFYSYKRVELRC
jgi:hypothetical protein